MYSVIVIGESLPIRVFMSILLLVVLSPINAFADDLELYDGVPSSFLVKYKNRYIPQKS